MGLLEEIRTAADSLASARQHTAELLAARNVLFVKAFEEGFTAKQIAHCAGLAPVAVYKVIYTPKGVSA